MKLNCVILIDEWWGKMRYILFICKENKNCEIYRKVDVKCEYECWMKLFRFKKEINMFVFIIKF